MKLTRLATSTAMALSVLVSSQLQAQEFDLSSEESKLGYSVGVNIGMNLAGQGLTQEVDNEALLQGIADAISGNEGSLKMSQDEMMATIQSFSMQQQAKAEAAAVEQAAASENFLVENAIKAGVTTTASGLQYLVLNESSDANGAMPTASDSVQVHYHGTLTDGTVFDSSVDRGEPISFPLNGVIPGWTEGLQLMKVGEKFRFFIPSDLAYGPSGAGPIGPNATLIFEVELLGIE